MYKYISDIECDIHRPQATAYTVMKHINKEEKDVSYIQVINAGDWLSHYSKLWESLEEMEDSQKTNKVELIDKLKRIKNRKEIGKDELNGESFKYVSETFKCRFLVFRKTDGGCQKF